MATPAIVQWFSSSQEVAVADTTLHIWIEDNTRANNCLILFLQCNTAPTVDPTAVDNIGNTWAVAVSVVSNQRLCCLVATGATAGVNHITVTFDVAANGVQFVFIEANNVSTAALATALDGTGSATLVSGSPVATSQITTAVDGDLILQYGVDDGGTIAVSHFTKGTGFTLLTTQLAPPMLTGTVVQYQVQATHGAITPTYTFTGTGDSDTIAIALKSAAAGTPRSAGIRVVGCQQMCGVANTTSMALQFPHIGNLIHVSAVHPDGLSSITDGDGHTYSGENNAFSGPVDVDSWRAINVSGNTDMTGPTVTWLSSSTATLPFVSLYDIIGADPNPKVQTVTNTGNQTVDANLDTVSITPVNQNSLIIVDLQIAIHTVSGLAAPTAANGGHAILGVLPAADGGSTTLDDDDGRALYYNGANLAAQTFTWTIQNASVPPVGVNSWGAFATEYKAATAGAGGLPQLGRNVYMMP